MDKPIIVTTPEALKLLISESASRAIIEALRDFKAPGQAQSQSELLTRQDARKKLKISLPTLADWTKRGLLKSYTIGGRVYYKSDELENSLTLIP
jgi:hypothetical protein